MKFLAEVVQKIPSADRERERYTDGHVSNRSVNISMKRPCNCDGRPQFLSPTMQKLFTLNFL